MDADGNKPWYRRLLGFSSSVDLWAGIGTIVAVLSLMVAIVSLVLAPDKNTSQPNPDKASGWLIPVVATFLIAVAIAVVSVAWLAARAAIRRRERRRDLVEVLLAKGSQAAEAGFSSQAQEIFVTTIEEYSRSLFDLSKDAFQRDGSDVVSQRHVQRAAEFLGSGFASRRGRHIGAVGGVLLGAGISVWSDILIDKKYSPMALSISLVVSLIGVAFVVYNWLRD